MNGAGTATTAGLSLWITRYHQRELRQSDQNGIGNSFMIDGFGFRFASGATRRNRT
jgi:hypothetical protein